MFSDSAERGCQLVPIIISAILYYIYIYILVKLYAYSITDIVVRVLSIK